MSLLHLPAAGRSPRPWKNGGGTTVDVLTLPEGAGADDFALRVSIAQVEADGPFSVFPGIDRLTAILSGEGLELAIGDAAPVRLTPASAALAYPGDVATTSRLLGGPVADLNVMVRRGRARGAMRRLSLAAGEVLAGDPGPALLVWLEGTATVTSAGAAVPIRPAPLDAILASEGEAWTITAQTAAVAWLVSLTSRP